MTAKSMSLEPNWLRRGIRPRQDDGTKWQRQAEADDATGHQPALLHPQGQGKQVCRRARPTAQAAVPPFGSDFVCLQQSPGIRRRIRGRRVSIHRPSPLRLDLAR